MNSDDRWAEATEELRVWLVSIGAESFDNPRALAADSARIFRASLSDAVPTEDGAMDPFPLQEHGYEGDADPRPAAERLAAAVARRRRGGAR